ncbi:hypothetical protein BASA81_003236 [Batrachochytrium salamandrivorans]|nr:hypothetical protein BASA81_003236 [Batrachochytrium salamandrivorans]
MNSPVTLCPLVMVWDPALQAYLLAAGTKLANCYSKPHCPLSSPAATKPVAITSKPVAITSKPVVIKPIVIKPIIGKRTNQVEPL